MSDDTYTLEAEIIEALPNAMFRVKLNDPDKEAIVHTAGKLRRPRLRIYLGDRVEVAFSPYDNELENGRIVKRLD
ncbi:MAG: translation initiation factor IF-1 [Candidatus Lernaella stagnicola]|nr:translation initiation factor IF-1 [Candidatus Lernaella stagnicola]